MPHVTIEMLPGRSEEIKQNLAEQISITVAGCVKVNPSDVSVSIQEIPADIWKSKVYDRVLREEDTLFLRPKKM